MAENSLVLALPNKKEEEEDNDDHLSLQGKPGCPDFQNMYDLDIHCEEQWKRLTALYDTSVY